MRNWLIHFSLFQRRLEHIYTLSSSTPQFRYPNANANANALPPLPVSDTTNITPLHVMHKPLSTSSPCLSHLPRYTTETSAGLHSDRWPGGAEDPFPTPSEVSRLRRQPEPSFQCSSTQVHSQDTDRLFLEVDVTITTVLYMPACHILSVSALPRPSLPGISTHVNASARLRQRHTSLPP